MLLVLIDQDIRFAFHRANSWTLGLFGRLFESLITSSSLYYIIYLQITVFFVQNINVVSNIMLILRIPPCTG